MPLQVVLLDHHTDESPPGITASVSVSVSVSVTDPSLVLSDTETDTESGNIPEPGERKGQMHSRGPTGMMRRA